MALREPTSLTSDNGNMKMQDRVTKPELLLFEPLQAVGKMTPAHMQLCRAQCVICCVRSVRDNLDRSLVHTNRPIILSLSII